MTYYIFESRGGITKLDIEHKSQCSMTGVTRPWYVLSCLWDGAYKSPLLLIRMSSPCGVSGFPLSLSVWSFTICLTPYNRK